MAQTDRSWESWAHPWCRFCAECLLDLQAGLPAGECCIGCKHCNECEVRKGGDIVVIMARVPTTRGCLPPVYNPMYRCKCPPFPSWVTDPDHARCYLCSNCERDIHTNQKPAPGCVRCRICVFCEGQKQNDRPPPTNFIDLTECDNKDADDSKAQFPTKQTSDIEYPR